MGMGVEQVRYLSMSGCTAIEGVDDQKEFDEVRIDRKHLEPPPHDPQMAVIVVGRQCSGPALPATVQGPARAYPVAHHLPRTRIQVSKAMGTVGLSGDDTSNVWECIAALMLFGNIRFGSGDKGVVGDTATMSKAAGLLGVDDVQV